LFDLVAEACPGTEEAEFVDEVQKSLRLGRFLLLISRILAYSLPAAAIRSCTSVRRARSALSFSLGMAGNTSPSSFGKRNAV
jgi:hypothetical protein